MRKLTATFIAVILSLGFATPAESNSTKYTAYQKTLATYSGNNTSLSSLQKSQIRATLEKTPLAEKFICTGIRYYDQPMSINIMVRKRAKEACEYAKELKPSLSTWYQNKPTKARSYAGKVLLTVKSPLPENKVEPSAIEICKIPDGRPSSISQTPPGLLYKGDIGRSNVGFPYSKDRFSSTGPVNFIVAAVSFEDLPGAPSQVDDYLAEQTAKISEWADFWSQGQMQYEFQTVEGWQQLDFSSTKYSAADLPRQDRTVSQHVGLANEIAAKIGNEVDWQKADGLFVLFPVGYTAFTGDWNSRGDLVQTPTGQKSMFFWGGSEYHLTDNGGGIPLETKQEHLWSFWIHEILHSQGSNLHAPGNGWAVGVGQNQYPTFGGKFSAVMNSWEAFKKGWILDDQVFCLDGREDFSEARVSLTPMEIYGGEQKMAVVRTAEHEGIVVTSRRPVGYSEDWASSDAGIMAYRLDLRVMNDRSGEGNLDCGNSTEYAKWAYYLPPEGAPAMDNACRFESFVMKPGERVRYGGTTINYLSKGSTDFIEISSVASLNVSQPLDSSITHSFSVLGLAPTSSQRGSKNQLCGCCGCIALP